MIWLSTDMSIEDLPLKSAFPKFSKSRSSDRYRRRYVPAHRCWPNDGLLNGFCHIGVKAGDFDNVHVIVASNLPVLAHDFERTVHFVGESA